MEIEMAFHVGQKVECVSVERAWRRSSDATPRSTADPVRGGRYVVDGIAEAWGMGFLSLVGFVECFYAANSFRPLVDDQFKRLDEIAADPPKAPVRVLQPAGVV